MSQPAPATAPQHHRDGYEISDDPARLQLDVIHGYLHRSYWAKGIPKDVVARSLAHSLCFGVYEAAGGAQVGFARLVTDRATFAYLADVFVLEAHRGRGLSKWLLDCVHGHPDVRGLRRWALVTADAHGLYARTGYAPLERPERWMEIHDPELYRR